MRRNELPHKLIAIEGINGTGKTTVCQRLEEKLNDDAREAEFDYMGADQANLFLSNLPELVEDGSLDVERIQKEFGKKRYHGAFFYDEFPYRNPTQALDKEKIDKKYSRETSFIAHLLSLYCKNKVIAEMLKLADVICDRHIYSIVARTRGQLGNTNIFNMEESEIIKPDLYALLTVSDEEVRQGRIYEREKLKRRTSDLHFEQKSEDSMMEFMEDCLVEFRPDMLIDCTHESAESVAIRIREKLRDMKKTK